MGAVERAEFSNHVAHVIFDRAFRDTEFVGDLLVAPSGSEVTQYIQFAPGKGLSKGLRGFSLGLMGGQAREVVEEFCRYGRFDEGFALGGKFDGLNHAFRR